MNILIPTDFSPVAEHAALFALTLKELTAERIFFFHAGVTDGADEQLNTFISNIQAKATNNNLNFTRILREGSFNDDTLNKVITEFSIDVVILGTHGREGFIKSLLGSHTSHVINNIRCPVLTIPEAFHFRTIRKIGYASDLTMLTKEVGQILPFAGMLSAWVDIVHIHPIYPEHISLDQYNTNEALKKLKEEYEYEKFQFQFIETKKENQTIEGLNQYIAEHSPDMIATFTRERGLLDKILDPGVTANLAVHTHIPLLSLPVVRGD